ncbi:hypothetical protein [Anaplasma bovis]
MCYYGVADVDHRNGAHHGIEIFLSNLVDSPTSYGDLEKQSLVPDIR